MDSLQNLSKPVLATNIDGLLICHDAFIKPHEAWFRRAIEKTGNEDLALWIGKDDYFRGVDEAMEDIMPGASVSERIKQARIWYQEDVVSYIKEHPDCVFRDVSLLLNDLKKKYVLALITTNSKEYIGSILSAAGLDNLYDIIFSVDIDQKPDKISLFKSFVDIYGVPKAYVGSKNKDLFVAAKEAGCRTLYAAHDSSIPDPDIVSIADATITKIPDLSDAAKKQDDDYEI